MRVVAGKYRVNVVQCIIGGFFSDTGHCIRRTRGVILGAWIIEEVEEAVLDRVAVISQFAQRFSILGLKLRAVNTVGIRIDNNVSLVRARNISGHLPCSIWIRFLNRRRIYLVGRSTFGRYAVFKEQPTGFRCSGGCWSGIWNAA